MFRTCRINAGIGTSPSLLCHQFFWDSGGWVTLGQLGAPIFSPTVQESRPLPQHTREGLDKQMVVDLDDVDTKRSPQPGGREKLESLESSEGGCPPVTRTKLTERSPPRWRQSTRSSTSTTSTGSNCSSQGQRNSSCSFSQVTCIVRRVIFVSIVIFSWRLSCVITCCTLDLGVRNPQGQEPFPPGMSGSFFTSLIFESFLFCPVLAESASERLSLIIRPKAPEHQLCSGARGRTIYTTQLWTDFLVSQTLCLN